MNKEIFIDIIIKKEHLLKDEYSKNKEKWNSLMNVKVDKRLSINENKIKKNKYHNHHVIPTWFELIPIWTINKTIKWIKKNIWNKRLWFRIDNDTLFLSKNKTLYLSLEEHTKLHQYLDHCKYDYYLSVTKDKELANEYNKYSFHLINYYFHNYYKNWRNWIFNKSKTLKKENITYVNYKKKKGTHINKGRLLLKSKFELNYNIQMIEKKWLHLDNYYLFNLITDTNFNKNILWIENHIWLYKYIVKNYINNNTTIKSKFSKYIIELDEKKLFSIKKNNLKLLWRYKEHFEMLNKYNYWKCFNDKELLIIIDWQWNCIYWQEILWYIFINEIEILNNLKLSILYINGENKQIPEIRKFYENIKK